MIRHRDKSSSGSLWGSATMALASFAALLAATTGAATCQPIQNPVNHHYYERVDSPGIDWFSARSNADSRTFVGLHGHLATITSADEQQFIETQVMLGATLDGHWLGGYQDHSAPSYSEPSTGWRWITGEAWGYTNWGSGEPNNVGGNEDWLLLRLPLNCTWNDLFHAGFNSGNMGNGFIVEYEAFDTVAVGGWPKAFHDARNTGRSPAMGPNSPILRWRTQLSTAYIMSAPTVGSGGDIYVPTAEAGDGFGRLFKLAGSDGAPVWNFAVPNGGLGNKGIACLSASGQVVFGSDDGNAYALGEDGAQVWSNHVGDGPSANHPTIGPDGTRYITHTAHFGLNGSLTALTAAGDLKWSIPLQQFPSLCPAIGQDGTIYVSAADYGSDGMLYALNPDGSVRWASSVAPHPYASPRVREDGSIVIGTRLGSIICVDPFNGAVLWESARLSSNSIDQCFPYGPSLLSDGRIVTMTQGGLLTMLSSNGDILWQHATAGAQAGAEAPAVDLLGRVYVAETNQVSAYDSSGNHLWSFAPEGAIWGGPVLTDDGRLLFCTSSSWIYCLDATPDTVGPEIDVMSPAEGANYSFGSSLTVEFTATDAESGVAEVNATLNGAPVLDGQFVTLLHEGPNNLTVNATDTAGNSTTKVVTFTVNRTLNSLDGAGIWLGLKNSDDVGTSFDLQANVYINGNLVGSGQLLEVSGGSSGFNNALLRTVPISVVGSTTVHTGDTLSVTIYVRISAGSRHRSGTARLWFNDSAANSNFGATIDGTSSINYLLSGFLLGNSPGGGPKKTVDITVDRAAGGNPFKPFGTWSKTIQ